MIVPSTAASSMAIDTPTIIPLNGFDCDILIQIELLSQFDN